MEHFPYLFAAYTIVWVVLFLYVLSLDRRARRAEKDLEELKRILVSRPGRADTRS
jgi:CcmD family protein